MKGQLKLRSNYYLPVKTITVLIIILSIIGMMAFGFKDRKNISGHIEKPEFVNKDSIESVKAFLQVYKVLMSPRCMNCHPSGDIPLQGDDSHLHTMFPRRGTEGKGIYAMKCANCHQPS